MNIFLEFHKIYKRRIILNHNLKWLPVIIIGVAAVLRFIQFAANRSLWLDESMLALNILTKSFTGLFQPLDYFQVAPIGFLVLEKALVGLLGNNEFVLRLFPFVCGISSLFLFWYVANYSIRKNGVIWALCLFGFSKYLIYYSGELKQYASDVVITLILYCVTIYIRQKEGFKTRYVFVYGVVGAIAIWFSLPSAFVLAGVGTSLFVFSGLKRDWQRAGWLASSFLFWLVSFGAYILIYTHGISDNLSFQRTYWQNAFMPFPPLSISDVKWFADKFFGILQNPVGLTFNGIGALCFLCGGLSLFDEDKEWFFCLLGPIFAALLVSGFQVYPFTSRTLLFIVPSFYIVIGHGLSFIWEKLQHISKMIYVMLLMLLLMHPVYFASMQLVTMKPNKAIVRENIKPVMKYLKEHKRQGDLVYLFNMSQYAFKYYAERYGFRDLDYKDGYSIHYDLKKDLKDIHKDLDQLRGHERVWLLFAHFKDEGLDYERLYLSYLDVIGHKIDLFKDVGASIHLYDLSMAASQKG